MDRNRKVGLAVRVFVCAAMLGLVGPAAASAAIAHGHAAGASSYSQRGAGVGSRQLPADECDGVMMRNAGFAPHM